MKAEWLLLLDNHDARKLVVTWDLVGRKRRRDYEVWNEWAKISSVHIADVQRIAPGLHRTEICPRRADANRAAVVFVASSVRDAVAEL